MTDQQPVSPEAIKWAYRLFLAREVEDEAAISHHLQMDNLGSLREKFVRSDEFQKNILSTHTTALTGYEPPVRVDDISDEQELEKLLSHIGQVWKHLGEVEPHWSVLTAEEYKQDNLDNNKAAFYESGKANVDCFLKTLERNAVNPSGYRSCIEYGCGVGRITRWLAEQFETVHGYDISKPHLDSADAYLREKGLNNVVLHQVQQVKELQQFPPVDVIYSLIVLQHNPPPIMILILEGMMKALKPGGVAYFQIPTYKPGYEFTLASYLDGAAKAGQMEMHMLPQRKIFEIVTKFGGQVLEVIEDGWTGTGHKEMSNTFLIQKS